MNCNASINPAFQPSIPTRFRQSPPLTPRTHLLPPRLTRPRQHRRASLPAPFSPPPAPLQCSLTTWDTLRKSDFDARLSSSSLALCLVGMSNCGKSHRSRQLHHAMNFDLVCVDDQIEAAIKPELTALGYSGIDGLAAWMGFPADARFVRNEATYLQHEEAVTGAVKVPWGRNFVLDTTGSVVYLSGRVLESLRSEFLVVHLEASDDMLEMMTESYFETPKPVVWGQAYRPRKGEEEMKALRRCYPGLLRERRERYSKMCHVTVPAESSLSRAMGVHKFLDCVRDRLR